MIVTEKRFRLAPMSPVILILTLILLAIPALFLAGAVLRHRLMGAAGILVTAIYAWVWLRFRPTEFVVRPTTLDIVWPLKRRQLRRDGIASVRLVDRSSLHAETGWGMRVGAGGLWGGFGWLWTQRRGIVQMYISRTDNLVWIERVDGRPWLITPQRPEAFVRALKTALSVLVGVLLAAAPATAEIIGFQRIAVADSDDKPREVGICYPSDGLDLSQPLGPYRHTLAVDGPMIGGKRGLVVILHGVQGWFGNHYQTALALADAGFVVAAVTHGDDIRLVERPRHVGRVLDYMLTDWSHHDRLDARRVGVFGFSAASAPIARNTPIASAPC